LATIFANGWTEMIAREGSGIVQTKKREPGARAPPGGGFRCVHMELISFGYKKYTLNTGK